MGDKDNTFKVPSTWNMIEKANKDKVDRIMNPGEPELKEWHPELEPKYIGKALFQGAIESKRSEKEYEDVLKEMLASPDEETKMAAINAMERSKANQVRDFITDVGVDVAAGALLGAVLGGGTGVITGDIKGRKTGEKDVAEIIDWTNNLASKTDVAKNKNRPGDQEILSNMIAKTRSPKVTNEIDELMKSNKEAAIRLLNGDISKKEALSIIAHNTEKESSYGPFFVDDIYNIFRATKMSPGNGITHTNMSNSQIKEVLANWIKNSKENRDLFDLLVMKDSVAGKHSERVVNITKALAELDKLNPEQTSILLEAALLHDIGKITVPNRLLNSGVDFRNTNEPKEITNIAKNRIAGHDKESYEILKRYKDEIAKLGGGHHFNKEFYDGSDIEKYIPAADIYESISTGDRDYHGQRSVEDSLNEARESKWNIPKFGEDYLDYIEKLQTLRNENKLPGYIKKNSVLAEAQKFMRRNALKKNIINEYRDAYAKKQAKTGSLLGAGIGAGIGTGVGIGNELAKNWKRNASGGIEPTLPAYTSDVLNEAWPWWRDKKDKSDEIVKWIKDGLLSEDQMELFKNTDFNSNKAVTALWERLSKELN